MTNARFKWAVIFGVAALLALVAWQVWRQQEGGPAQDQTVRMQKELMGTIWTIQVWVEAGQDPVRAAVDIAQTFHLVEAIELVMSEWIPESPISRLNQSAGRERVAVPPELADLIRRGIEYGRLSDGAFDISWKGMGHLWKFGDDFRVPSQEKIDRALPRVDYRLIEVSQDAAAGTFWVRLPKEGMALGLGGIAKGYAIDQAGALLRRKGYSNFLVDGGGDVLTSGRREGRAWTVGLRDPGAGDDASPGSPPSMPAGPSGQRPMAPILMGQMEVSGGAVATSGDYQRFRIVDGVRYHHIIDPRSGRPARGCRSVTVVAPSAEQADALATAIFVLGPEEGLSLAASLDEVETLIVDSQGDIHQSEGFSYTPAAMTR